MKEAFRFFVVILFSLIYRIELVNKENIPEKGAALLCANHIGELDMFVIGYKLKRWVHWMAKEELFKIPLLGAFITSLGAFPVKRGKGDVGSIKKAFSLLEQGHILGMFPEGTRTRDKSKKDIKIKPGAAMIAVNSGVPIVPVAIRGSYKLFGRIKVVFGNPYTPDADKSRKYSGDELGEISKEIMNKVYSLLEGA